MTLDGGAGMTGPENYREAQVLLDYWIETPKEVDGDTDMSLVWAQTQALMTAALVRATLAQTAIKVLEVTQDMPAGDPNLKAWREAIGYERSRS